jgi:F-type H+-transporting ATPase subunit epsilon
MPLTVEIVTAERKLLEESGIDEVIAPGVEGQLAVLPMHAAFMTMLAPGELILKKGGEEHPYAVTGGFFEVLNDRVIVLADAAERAEEIDVERAEAARARAQQALERRESLEEAAAMQAALARSMVRIKVAESLRRRRGARTTTPHA